MKKPITEGKVKSLEKLGDPPSKPTAPPPAGKIKINKAENAISWLLDEIKDQSTNYTVDPNDMQKRLMKISSYAYVIEVLEQQK